VCGAVVFRIIVVRGVLIGSLYGCRTGYHNDQHIKCLACDPEHYRSFELLHCMMKQQLLLDREKTRAVRQL
jgi:hypothetical protein